MSAPRTGACQLDRLRTLGLCTTVLGAMHDVDEFDDARAVAAMVPGSRFAAAVGAAARTFQPALHS